MLRDVFNNDQEKMVVSYGKNFIFKYNKTV